MSNRYGYILNEDGTTNPLSDANAIHRGESVAHATLAANAEMLGGFPPSAFAKIGETGITMELLWENASPTSEFAEHIDDNAIQVNTEEGDIVFIEFCNAVSNYYTIWSMHKADGKRSYLSYALHSGNTIQVAVRDLFVKPGAVEFESCLVRTVASPGSSVISNNLIIPVRIYKVK